MILTPQNSSYVLDRHGVDDGIRQAVLELFSEIEEINFEHDDPADWCEYDGDSYFDFRDARSHADGRVLGQRHFSKWIRRPDEDDRVRPTKKGVELFRDLMMLEAAVAMAAS